MKSLWNDTEAAQQHKVKVVSPNSDHRSVLIAYLLAKVEIGDWHGVSDAANDLRELEVYERIKRETP